MTGDLGARYRAQLSSALAVTDAALATFDLREPGDWRLRNQLALDVALRRWLSIELSHTLDYRHRPIEAFRGLDQSFRRRWSRGSEEAMTNVRIALANIRFPADREESVALATGTIAEAGGHNVSVICFPECFVPGYRAPHTTVAPPDAAFLERAWDAIAGAAASARVAVVLGTERLDGEQLLISALVINADGTRAGFQDKVQLDPTEDGLYVPAATPARRVFHCGPLTFGVAVCHEGWRYPETVRAAVRQGAHVVFHPHYHWAERDSYRPAAFADPANTFHEKAALCRAAENTCYFATVNYASDGSGTTSAVVAPDGTLLAWQPYGREGLLVADIDLEAATGLLAMRYRDQDNGGG